VHLRSLNDNDFNVRYPAIVKALARLPDNTVIDGEVVAFDQDGRPSFNDLHNYGAAPAPVMDYVFDVMMLAGRDVMREPLEKRRELLDKESVAQAYRASQVQEFVIGGYTRGTKTFDALVFGYYEERKLMRHRNG
jgi:ATP-dependent DNA ligase